MVMGPVWRLSDRLRSFPKDLHDHFVAVAADVGKAVATIRTQVSMPFQDALVSEVNGQQRASLREVRFPVSVVSFRGYPLRTWIWT